MASGNPLLSDRTAEFLLFEVLDAEALCALPYFADHSRATFELYLQASAKLAREAVYPTYKPMDEFGAHYRDGRVLTHPAMAELYPKLVELGLLTAARSAEVGGQQLPLTVSSAAAAYLMAANAGAYGYCMLTSGRGAPDRGVRQRRAEGALHAADVRGRLDGHDGAHRAAGGQQPRPTCATRARPTADGHYLISGAKIFISGGDQRFDREHRAPHARAHRRRAAGHQGDLAVRRAAAARAGRRAGPTTTCTPRARSTRSAGAGCRVIALNFGESGDCHGWLVGEPNQGLSYMFQMMNEARIMVGLHARRHGVGRVPRGARVRARTQRRGARRAARPSAPPVPIIEHADVRRMLLRQKAIVEGGLALRARDGALSRPRRARG